VDRESAKPSFAPQIGLEVSYRDFEPKIPLHAARVYPTSREDQAVFLDVHRRGLSSKLPVRASSRTVVAPCTTGQFQNTMQKPRKTVTSKQTQPNAYTSVAGVRANLSPKRPGSSSSGAIQLRLPPRFVLIVEVASEKILSPKSVKHALQSSLIRIFACS
jgi:hypothetical protein